jgi:hypothetical protein
MVISSTCLMPLEAKFDRMVWKAKKKFRPIAPVAAPIFLVTHR